MFFVGFFFCNTRTRLGNASFNRGPGLLVKYRKTTAQLSASVSALPVRARSQQLERCKHGAAAAAHPTSSPSLTSHLPRVNHRPSQHIGCARQTVENARRQLALFSHLTPRTCGGRAPEFFTWAREKVKRRFSCWWARGWQRLARDGFVFDRHCLKECLIRIWLVHDVD